MRCIRVCTIFLGAMVWMLPYGFAQNKIYLNKKTGVHAPVYGGNYSKTTDSFERAAVTVAITGPIKYSVDPPDLLIFENQTRSWSGTIFPDVANAPAPGDSASANLAASYSMVYSRPEDLLDPVTVLSTYTCPSCAAHDTTGTHQVVRKEGVKNYPFTIYSVDVTLPDTIEICGSKKGLMAKGFPAGGVYQWSVASGANISFVDVPIEGDSSLVLVDYDMWMTPYTTTGSMKVIYTVGGVAVSKTCVVKLPDVSPFTEYDLIRSFFCAIYAQARPSFPTLGNGYLGNVWAGEGVCIILHDSLKAIHNRMITGRKFCHFKLGMASYFYTDYLNLGHMFVGCFDRKNKLYTYADPWRFDDCLFRAPPASSTTWSTAPW